MTNNNNNYCHYKLSLLSYNFNIFRVFVAVCDIFGIHLKMID